MKTYIKRQLKPLYLKLDLGQDKKRLREKLAAQNTLKIVVGSSGIFESGWVPTEIDQLNLLKESTWRDFFAPNSISNILAEHVWEHLSPEDGEKAAVNCFKFLEPSGRLRVAVPDGYHVDPDYIEHVKPGGLGDGATDHKVLYNYESFSKVFEKAGFQVRLLEYFNEYKEFQHYDWSVEEGMIHRSLAFDKRNSDGLPNYTSLILDAIKE